MFGGLKQQSQIKNNLWQNHIVSFQYDATMRRCWVTADTNDGYLDAANANKSCVRVHGGQSSEFPVYPTTRERGIRYGELSSQRSHSNAYAVLSPLAATPLMAQTQSIIVTCTGFHAFGKRSQVWRRRA